MRHLSGNAPLPYVAGTDRGERSDVEAFFAPLSPSTHFFHRHEEGGFEFTQHLEEATERRLQGLLDDLWAATHSEVALEAAQKGPRAEWNPYRPSQRDPGVWQEVLNSIVYEFREVVPVDSLFVSGFSLFEAFNGASVEHGEGVTVGREAGDFSFYIPHELNKLCVEGHSLPILNPSELSGSDTTLSGFEEILSHHGTPPVDVFALDDTKGGSLLPTRHNKLSRDNMTPSIIPPEILAEVEMLVFDRLWDEVVVPYYVEQLSDNSTGIMKNEESKEVSKNTLLPKIASSKISRCSQRFLGSCGKSNIVPLLENVKTKKKGENRMVLRDASRFDSIQLDTSLKSDGEKVPLSQSVRSHVHTQVLRKESRVSGTTKEQGVLEESLSNPKRCFSRRRPP
ncbi:unnamed protein product [Phytomonas sp. Hart1]|nr:unnamed protein product [Phytomonas sp. Hart1]|eukprot:CCW70031.1 unnamed protein product [Phytomonas sp. isolate Hart1]